MSNFRIKVATTRTMATNPTRNSVAVHVLPTSHCFNGEDEDGLTNKDWRIMFVELPQLQTDVKHPYLVREAFPSDVPWVDLTCGDEFPPQWVPSLVALRGTVTRFEIDPPTGEEEVDLTIEILPADSDLLEMAKTGPIADKLYTACLRAVNLFPRGRVELGSSFTAFISMGFQRVRTSFETSEKFSLMKIVWDLQVAGSPLLHNTGIGGLVRRTWRHMFNQKSAWSSSGPEDNLFSPVEASMVMDLHAALFQLWHEQFGKNEGFLAQLRAQTSEVVYVSKVRPAYGRSTLRPWTGPKLFSTP